MKKNLPDIISVIAVCIISLIAAILITAATPITVVPIGDADITVGINTEYEEQGASARRSVFDKTKKIQTVGNVDTSKAGVYEITYSVKDRGKTRTAVRKVTVKDMVAPVVTINGEDTVEVDYITDYEDPGACASDDIDGDLTESILRTLKEVPRGENETGEGRAFEYIYTVTDKTGNKGEAKRLLHVKHSVTVSDGNPDGKSFICLTFDDGPSKKTTNKILDILMAYDIKATFFICDYTEDEKELVQRIVNDGHTLAIHAKSHNYSYIYSSPDNYMNEIDYMQKKIQADTGYNATVLRFPGGSSNTISRSYSTGIMTTLAEQVEAAGYRYFDWNADSGDARGDGIAPDTLYENFVHDISHDRTNVVLMHDTGAKRTTAEALPKMIEYGIKNGYTFCPITKDTPDVHHTINN